MTDIICIVADSESHVKVLTIAKNFLRPLWHNIRFNLPGTRVLKKHVARVFSKKSKSYKELFLHLVSKYLT